MSILMSLMLLTSSVAQTEAPKSLIQTGKASFYAKKFDGRRTTSGERVNNSVFSAAHKTLPFNTLVEVTNLANNRSVIVRVNDRGPFVRGRIIDLTYSAAKALGYIGHGIANVTVRVIGKGSKMLAANTPNLSKETTVHYRDAAALLQPLGPVD